jgi:uncharacterized membrane protein
MERKRIWEIDFFRSIAIFLMVVFHIIYDLNQFSGIDLNYLSGFWYWEGRAAALIFIFLAGISSGFSRNTVRRGLKVFGLGLLITVITFIFFGKEYVLWNPAFFGNSYDAFPGIEKNE